jgi:ribokinase
MPRVVVLGSSGYDLTIRLPRLPRPGETLLGGRLQTGPGGKGANAAIAARRAGAEVVFLTAFGDDDFGRRLLDHDRAEGLDLSYAKTVPGVANQTALIFVGDDGQNLIAVAPEASSHLAPDDIDALPDALFRPGDVLLACLELPLPAVARGLGRAARAGMLTILNPAPADPAILDAGILPHVAILTPNQEEAATLAGRPVATRDDAIAAAASLRDRGGRDVIVTLGADGALAAGAEGAVHVPGVEVDVVDTTGAGDTVNGALAAELARGATLPDAARFALRAAAISTTRPGARGGMPRRHEVAE